jgi:uncharacterized protein (TIGR03663 family)
MSDDDAPVGGDGGAPADPPGAVDDASRDDGVPASDEARTHDPTVTDGDDTDDGPETASGRTPSDDGHDLDLPPDHDDGPALSGSDSGDERPRDDGDWRSAFSRTFLAVVAFAGVALLARLVTLGERAAHWDEGRVAYWTLQYARTGYFEYRPIVHGPFLFQVNSKLFAFLGPSDFVSRLPVAVVGGLLPLSAWLFRERLRRREVLALAALLAFNPLLLYYSRFMRNDVLVAGFTLFALGFFVRTIDAGRARSLYLGTASLALAFTTKENALVYVVCWLGALGLLLDHRLFGHGDRHGETVTTDGAGTGVGAVAGSTVWTDQLSSYARDLAWGAYRWRGPLVLAGVEFLAILVFFFAPRAGTQPGDIGLWKAVFGLDAGMFVAVFEAATVGAFEDLVGTWVATDHDISVYPDRFVNFLQTMEAGAGVVSVFAFVGFVVDRYSAGGPRDLVAFSSYWGFVSVLGYPYATDIWAPWVTVHAIVPLAVPAAVGIGVLFGWARDATVEGDGVTATLSVTALLVLAAPMGVTAVDAAYLNSDTDDRVLGGSDPLGKGNEGNNQHVLQWAQPENDLKNTLGVVEEVARTNDGHDVLFFGSKGANGENNFFYVPSPECTRRPPVHEPRSTCDGVHWHSRLPLPWYMAAMDANTTSTKPGADPTEALRDPPPVVVAYGWDNTKILGTLPPGYTPHQHRFKLWSEEVVVYVRDSAVPSKVSASASA